MFRFLVRALLRGIAILLGAVLIVFLLMHAIPGNPWSNYSSNPRMMLGLGIDKPIQQNLNRHFGLDLPLWRQFTRYIIGDVYAGDKTFTCGAVCGNLGPSIIQRDRSVQNALFAPPDGLTFWQSRFGYSIRLIFFGFVAAVIVGIPLGIVSAVTTRKTLSRSISIALAALISIPNFILGLLAIIVFASWLKIITVIPDWDNPTNWIVPTIVLSAMPMASIARATSAFLKNILNEDYIRTAHAKGLSNRRVILDHIFRNAIVPIITFLGPVLMDMFAGIFVVENLYSFPGIGRDFWEAVLELDYPMILGLTLIYATGIVILNFLNDILCDFLDPRIRVNGEEDFK
jgi:oligopeptide transport system permease protein